MRELSKAGLSRPFCARVFGSKWAESKRHLPQRGEVGQPRARAHRRAGWGELFESALTLGYVPFFSAPPPTRNFQRVRAGNFDLPALGKVTFGAAWLIGFASLSYGIALLARGR
jgi:hypothetical protein